MKLGKFIKPLMILGLLMCGFAILKLELTPGYIQYSFTPDGTQAEAVSALDSAALSSPAYLTGVKYSETVGSVSGVTVKMCGKGSTELAPIAVTCGDGLGLKSLQTAEKLCVPDESLAFKLFGNADPIGQSVDIGGVSYTVIGTARYSMGVGGTDEYCVWIPLASNENIKPDMLTVIAEELNETEISAAFGGGTYTDLGKERLRAYILPGCAAALIILTLLGVGLRAYVRALKGFASNIRERSLIMYAGRNILKSLPGGIALVLIAAAGIAVCVLLLRFFIQPVYVFTEWIPEDLVSMDSIITRFRELCAAAAKPVRYVTVEYAEIRFWAGLLRWGAILMVLSALRGFIKARLSGKDN